MKSKLGKCIWLTAAGLGFVLVVATLTLLQPSDNIQKSLADTRQSLRTQGFKTDLADFDLSASGDARTRAEDILNAGQSLPSLQNLGALDLQPLADTESVTIVWKLNYVQLRDSPVTWQSFHDLLAPLDPILDNAAAAAKAGPYRFDIELHGSTRMTLPHITALLKVSNALASRTILELHDGDDASAWTNLENLTHLAAGWQTEPVEVSQLMRCNLANNAFATTWQALQKSGWSEDQLATLQHEWDTVDFFQEIPDTVAFHSAFTVNICQQNRSGSITGFRPPGTAPSGARSPSAALAEVHDDWQEARYRSYGSYADEKNLLLYSRDREVEARNAIKATNWLQMQAMPGVTNVPEFKSPYPSRIQPMLQDPSVHPFGRLGGGEFARAAITETRRRLFVTAIALERYHLRHHAYPNELSDLIPDYLPAVPIDFMDGNPLRYHPTDDGHFLLYSVGLDGVDNGGTMKLVTSRPVRGGIVGLFGSHDADIVWPRPATDSQIKSMNEAAASELLGETNAPTGP